MFVQFYVHKRVNILMVNANAILVGKARNVSCAMMNAKYQTATDMVIVSAANVHVYVAIKENSVRKVRLRLSSLVLLKILLCKRRRLNVV